MTSATTQYQPGDIVNGHQLSADGTAWIPVPPTAITDPAPAPATRKGKGKKIAIGAAAAIVVLAAFGAMSGGSGAAESPVDQPTASAPADEEQAPKADTAKEQEQAPEPEAAPVPDMTKEQENAVEQGESYLDSGSFSKESLIDQLEFHGYSTADAKFAVEYLEDAGIADWQAEANESAESYLDSGSFSEEGLVDQLEFEGYTEKQATKAVDAADADWNAEAVESAESYLDSGSFSRSELIDQLEFEGYTNAQATYAVDQVGL